MNNENLSYREPYYVPTLNMDDPALSTAVAMRKVYVKPGQWVLRGGEMCRFLYVRGDGHMAFNKPKAGVRETIIARSLRMSAALRHFNEAVALINEGERKAIVNSTLSSLSLWGRIKLIAKGA